MSSRRNTVFYTFDPQKNDYKIDPQKIIKKWDLVSFWDPFWHQKRPQNTPKTRPKKETKKNTQKDLQRNPPASYPAQPVLASEREARFIPKSLTQVKKRERRGDAMESKGK